MAVKMIPATNEIKNLDMLFINIFP